MATATKKKAAPKPAPKPVPAPAVANDQQVHDFVQTNFPSYAWLLNEPEIMGLFRDAIDPTGVAKLSTNQITSKLEATNWWKTHGESVRQYTTWEQTDPSTLGEHIQAKDAEVHQKSAQLGVQLPPEQIDAMARDALKFGWSDAELQEQLVGKTQYNAANPETSNIGDIDNAMTQLKGLAASYYVPLSDPTAFAYARDVAAGHQKAEDYTAVFQQQAKVRFPTMAKFIDQGVTPKDFFAPYQEQGAKLLETAPTGIDLMNDPKWDKALNYSDPKTGEVRPMTMPEFGTYVRGMDQWKGTRQAQQSAADMAEGLLRMFGKSGGGTTKLVS